MTGIDQLQHMTRANILLNVMRNIEIEVSHLPKNNSFRRLWDSSTNWHRVQLFINSNTTKAGSTSSAEQCRFMGVDPSGYTFREVATNAANL